MNPPGGSGLASAEKGTGHPLLLLPGAAADRQMFLQAGCFDLMAERFRTIAVDWRGTGESPPPDDHDLAGAVADVVATLDAKGIEAAHVVGASHGAAVALSLAADFPERVTALGLCSPWEWTTPSMAQMLAIWRTIFSAGDMQAAGEAMLWWLLTPEFLDADPRRTKAMAAEMFASASAPAAEVHIGTVELNLEYDLRGRLESIAQPSLVLAAEGDRVIPNEYSRRVAEALPEARYELLSGAGSGHAFLIEMGLPPSELLLSFLASVPTS